MQLRLVPSILFTSLLAGTFACGTNASDDDDTDPGDVTGTIDLQPARLDFGQVSLAADPGKQTVMIANNTNATAKLALGFTGTDAAAFSIARSTCDVDLAPGASCSLDVALRVGHEGAYDAQLEAAFGEIRASAPIAATAIRAQLDISPTNDAYGEIDLTVSTTHDYTLTNAGQANLPAPQLAVTGASYTLASSNCTAPLAPAASCTFQVKFSPAGLGMQTGDVSAAVGQLTARSQFSGVGTALVTSTLSGNGTGTVSGGGLACGTKCSTHVSTGLVTLTATANPGSKLATWTGAAAACGSNVICNLPVTAPINAVGATFSDLPTLSVDVRRPSSLNGGTVKLTNPTRTCTNDCAFEYQNNTTVQLSGQGDIDNCVNFTGFSGACIGTGTCTLTLSADVTVVANFALRANCVPK